MSRINTTKISELPEELVLSDSDSLIKDNGIVTKKFSILTLVNYIKNHTMFESIYNHILNKENPHEITKEQIGLSNVENKSSETIRSEITSDDVTNALGFIPGEGGGNYSIATDSVAGLVKSGADINVDTNGNVTIKDNSHLHTVENITGLSNKTFEYRSSTEPTDDELNLGNYWIQEYS